MSENRRGIFLFTLYTEQVQVISCQLPPQMQSIISNQQLESMRINLLTQRWLLNTLDIMRH